MSVMASSDLTLAASLALSARRWLGIAELPDTIVGLVQSRQATLVRLRSVSVRPQTGKATFARAKPRSRSSLRHPGFAQAVDDMLALGEIYRIVAPCDGVETHDRLPLSASMSWTLTRIRFPPRWTLPSSTYRTFNSRPILMSILSTIMQSR